MDPWQVGVRLGQRVQTPDRDCGCTGMIIVRMDPTYCNASVTGAVHAQGARFSVTVPVNSGIRAAIAAIPEGARTAILVYSAKALHALCEETLNGPVVFWHTGGTPAVFSPESRLGHWPEGLAE
jgi:hypothetical protein